MANQGTVIDSLNRFLSSQKKIKFQLNEEGICSGLTILYLLAKARGEEKQFFQSQDNFAKLRRKDYDKNASGVSKFCAKAEVAFAPSRYKRSVTQANMVEIAEMLGEKSPVKQKFSTAAVCDTTAQLGWLLQQTVFEEDLIYLGSYDHAIGLVKRNGLFYLYDSNYEDGEKVFRNTKELAVEIKKQLPAEKNQKFKIHINVFTNPNKPNNQNNFPSKKQIAKKLYENANNDTKNQGLYIALMSGDSDMVDTLLEMGANLLAAHKGCPIFYGAYIYGHTDLVKKLEARPEMQNIPNTKWAEVLCLSVVHGVHPIYQDLIKRVPSQDIQNTLKQSLQNNTLLHLACQSGNEILVGEVLKNNPDDIFHQNEASETPLMQAVKKGHIKVVELLLQQKNIAQDKDMIQSSLHLALKHGHHTIVKMLCEHSAINIEKALPLAIQHGYTTIVEKWKTHINKSHLKIALNNGQSDIAILIYDQLTKGRLKFTWNELLIKALLDKNYEFIETMLGKENSTDFSTYNLTAIDVLDYLARIGDAKSLEIILQNKDIRLVAVNNAASLLSIAAKEGNYEVTKFFRTKYFLGYKTSETNRYLEDFHHAASKGDMDAIEAYIEAGANPQAVGKDGKAALEFAIMNFHPEHTVYMLEKIGRHKLDGELAKKIFKYACMQGSVLVIDWLIKNKIAINSKIESKSAQDSEKLTLIEIACKYYDEKVLAYLITNGANINPVKEKLLLLVAKYGYTQLLDVLPASLDYNTPITVTKDKPQKHVFDIVEEYSRWEILPDLLQKGAKIDQAKNQGENLLKLACTEGRHKEVETILKHAPSLQLSDEDFNDLFESACNNNQVNVIKALLATGKDLTQEDIHDNILTSLESAIQKDHSDILKYLGSPKLEFAKMFDIKLFFVLACKNQKPAMANTLLLSFNIVLADQAELIEHLKQAYRLEIPQSCDEKTMLEKLQSLAYQKGHIAIYQALNDLNHYSLLQEANSKLKLVDKNLQFKIKLKRNLKESDPQFSVKMLPSRSEELLDFASTNNQRDILLELLANGANPLKSKHLGLPMLFKACIENDKEVVHALIEKGVDISRMHEGTKVIDIAAVYGHKSLVKEFVDIYASKGVDVKLLLNEAVKKQQWELTAMLLEIIPAGQLFQHDMKLLQKHRYAIRDAYLELLKDPKNPKAYHADALSRLEETVNNLNGLGRLLHTPVYPFFFKFTQTTDKFGGKITKSIALFSKIVKELNDLHGVKIQDTIPHTIPTV